MKNLALALLIGLTAAPAAFARPGDEFTCPSETSFLKTFDQLLGSAKAVDATSEIEAAQNAAYLKVFATGIPNQDTLINHFRLLRQNYDLIVTKDDFVFNDPQYMDAYAVVFAAGSATPIAKISTDTDRHDYRCELIAADAPADDGDQKPADGNTGDDLPGVTKIVLPAGEFDNITIDSPQGFPIEINGVRYEHFYVVSANVAEAIDADGKLTLVYRGE